MPEPKGIAMSKTVRTALIVVGAAIAAAYAVTLLIIQSIGPVI